MSMPLLFFTVATLLLLVPTESTIYCPSDGSCAGQTFEFPPGNVVSFECNGYYGCDGTKFIISGGSTLDAWLNCWKFDDYVCHGVNVVAFNSDLISAWGLHCGGGYGACDSLNVTLVDTPLWASCYEDACRGYKAYLYGNSRIVFAEYSVFPVDRQIEVFLMSPNASIEDRGNYPYILHTYQAPSTTTELPMNNTLPSTSVVETTAAHTTETTPANDDSAHNCSKCKQDSVGIVALVIACLFATVVCVLLAQVFILGRTQRQLLVTVDALQLATAQKSAQTTVRVAMGTSAGNK